MRHWSNFGDLIWSGLVWSGLVWSGLVWSVAEKDEKKLEVSKRETAAVFVKSMLETVFSSVRF